MTTKSITTNQPIKIEGVEYPAGTKLGTYEARPGVPFDFVIGCLNRGCVEVSDDDGLGFGNEAAASDFEKPFAALDEQIAEALIEAGIDSREELVKVIASNTKIKGIGKASHEKIVEWLDETTLPE